MTHRRLDVGQTEGCIPMIDDFFARAHELVKKGEAFVTATVVRAEKPSSGKPGDRAIITSDGVMHGWIGGSCAQPTVVKEAMKALSDGETRFLRLSTESSSLGEREGLIDLPMTCFSGGTLEIYIEPHPPRPRLLIVGTLPVAQALTRLGAAMNYHVIVADLDGSGDDPGASVPLADETLTTLGDVAAQIRPLTFVVVATHGNYDELALEEILSSDPIYVGLVASPKRAAAVRDLLRERGITSAQMEPLKAPAGLDIQARRGDEIALSIMAEIVQHRRRAEPAETSSAHQDPMQPGMQQRGTQRTEAQQLAGGPRSESVAVSSNVQPEQPDGAHGADGADAAVDIEPHGKASGRASRKAVDPICGMDVNVSTARHTHEHAGRTYYFCCPGCQSRFAREPELYL